MSDEENSTRLARNEWRWPFWTRAIVFAFIVMVLGFVLDVILHWVYRTPFTHAWWTERILENTIEGACAGFIAYIVILDRERRIQKRFREIAYLNHHVRNALFPIVMLQGIEMETKERIEIIRDSSERIQRCLEKLSREENVGDFRDSPQQP